MTLLRRSVRAALVAAAALATAVVGAAPAGAGGPVVQDVGPAFLARSTHFLVNSTALSEFIAAV